MQKIVQGLTWHSNMLKVKDLPEIIRQKSEIAAREERAPETTRETIWPLGDQRQARFDSGKKREAEFCLF